MRLIWATGFCGILCSTVWFPVKILKRSNNSTIVLLAAFGKRPCSSSGDVQPKSLILNNSLRRPSLMLTYERFMFQSLSQRTNANYILENYLAMMPNHIPHISIILPVYHERRICNRGKIYALWTQSLTFMQESPVVDFSLDQRKYHSFAGLKASVHLIYWRPCLQKQDFRGDT